mmetsp:Transcript_16502/g.41408  ORF Transcript_16502/g.41408 Transcript_16502/m.41408 type:complete len:302 (-) Transcript_16502:363-1268(-)
MVQTRSKKNEEDHEESDPALDGNDVAEEVEEPKPSKTKRKTRQKKQKEDLKSKTMGVGLKISVDGGSSNKKIVFDDFVPSDDEENDNDVSTHDDKDLIGRQQQEEDDDDVVEEVQGTTARDEVLDQMKTEAQQSLKTKKKRKRKTRPEKEKDSDDEEDIMDEDFFAQLDTARQEELKEQEELAKSQAREAMKGKHTTFVFANNEEENATDPVDVNENIQVVVLNKDSGIATTSVSETALKYSRNLLKSGVDPLEGAASRKRKRNRSGPQEQPWKRAKKKLAMGRSRLTKGRPAAFFKRKKR